MSLKLFQVFPVVGSSACPVCVSTGEGGRGSWLSSEQRETGLGPTCCHQPWLSAQFLGWYHCDRGLWPGGPESPLSSSLKPEHMRTLNCGVVKWALSSICWCCEDWHLTSSWRCLPEYHPRPNTTTYFILIIPL